MLIASIVSAWWSADPGSPSNIVMMEVKEFDVWPGMADWDEPEARVHRAINVGDRVFEEVVTFYRENGSVDPQPEIDADT